MPEEKWNFWESVNKKKEIYQSFAWTIKATDDTLRNTVISDSPNKLQRWCFSVMLVLDDFINILGKYYFEFIMSF